MSFGRQWYGINGLNDATAACVVTVRRSMAHAHTGVVADGASIRLTIHRRTWRARGKCRYAQLEGLRSYGAYAVWLDFDTL